MSNPDPGFTQCYKLMLWLNSRSAGLTFKKRCRAHSLPKGKGIPTTETAITDPNLKPSRHSCGSAFIYVMRIRIQSIWIRFRGPEWRIHAKHILYRLQLLYLFKHSQSVPQSCFSGPIPGEKNWSEYWEAWVTRLVSEMQCCGSLTF